MSVWNKASESFRKGLIDGLISSDGNVNSDGSINFVSVHKKLIDDLASLFGCYGIKTRIKKIKEIDKEIYIKGKKIKSHKQAYSISISDIESRRHFSRLFKLSRKDKQERLELNISRFHKHPNIQSSFWRVKEINETERMEPVWDISVNHDDHSFELDHCMTGNCGEIILRDKEFCNLTEVIIRATDTETEILDKIGVATIIGTWQSTLTNFKYISRKWKENCEEERLLGVSLTGIMDNELTNGKKKDLDKRLRDFRVAAVAVNKLYAEKIGIPASVAITCGKPSGTVSQLVDSASGIHARHSEYYIRTVRADKKDPLSKMMVEMGFPVEDDVMKPETTYVFSFPIKSPKGAICRNDMTAIDQLELWLNYKQNWTEHNPSITVTVRENEWLDVGAWVYKNFDSMTGVSFLPHSDHTYKQAPYQECSKEEYEEMCKKIPKNVDWTKLVEYEKMDNTVGSQELACTSGNCEL
jgi:hypothetical protein